MERYVLLKIYPLVCSQKWAVVTSSSSHISPSVKPVYYYSVLLRCQRSHVFCLSHGTSRERCVALSLVWSSWQGLLLAWIKARVQVSLRVSNDRMRCTSQEGIKYDKHGLNQLRADHDFTKKKQKKTIPCALFLSLFLRQGCLFYRVVL